MVVAEGVEPSRFFSESLDFKSNAYTDFAKPPIFFLCGEFNVFPTSTMQIYKQLN